MEITILRDGVPFDIHNDTSVLTLDELDEVTHEIEDLLNSLRFEYEERECTRY